MAIPNSAGYITIAFIASRLAAPNIGNFSRTASLNGIGRLTADISFSCASDINGRATLSGTPQYSSSSDVCGRATLTANAVIGVTADVNGRANINVNSTRSATTSISGYARLESSVIRTGSSSISAYARVEAIPTFSASTSITGYARIDASSARDLSASISGYARLEANTSQGSTANISGFARLEATPTFSATSDIIGKANLSSAISIGVTSDISGRATLTAAGSSIDNASSQITGTSNLSATITRVGSSSVSAFARLDVTSAYSLDLYVNGKANLNANLTFNAASSLRGIARVDSSPAFGSNAQISGYARLTSDLVYSCNAQITGKATLDGTGTVATDTLVTASINGFASLNATNFIEYIRTADVNGIATIAANVTYNGFSTGIYGTANLSVSTWYIQFTIFPLVTIRGTANLSALITAFTRTSSIQASAQLASVQTITDPTYLLCNVYANASLDANVSYQCVVSIRAIATLTTISISPTTPGISKTAVITTIARLVADYVVPPECECPNYGHVFNLTCAWEYIPPFTSGINFEIVDITTGIYEKPPTCMDAYEIPQTISGVYTAQTCTEVAYENIMPLIDGTEVSPFCVESTDLYDVPYTLPVFRWHIMSRELSGNAEYDVVDITNGQFEREQTLVASVVHTETLPQRFKRVGCL